MPESPRIRFPCPKCHKSVSVAVQHAGKSGKCPGCGVVIQVPLAAPGADKQPEGDLITDSIDSLKKKYDAEYAKMPSRERVRILREGGPREQEAMLLTAARYEADEPFEFAAIDLLGCGTPAVQSAALQLIIKKDWISAAAWKIAYEFRGRAIYVWELSKNAKIMSSFAATPVLGVERARNALEFVRREMIQATLKANFEERFHTFTLESEPLVDAPEATRRLADMKLCRQCGKRMRMTPQGPYVQLRCEQCDITRFEKAADL